MNKTIVLGGGCFWCLEAFFFHIRGVVSVMPGYAGGSSPAPNYESVCGGKTGHAEVIQVTYNPHEIPLKDLLLVFFTVHNPTTKNRQRNDVGTQYRSLILYTTDDEKLDISAVIERLETEKAYNNPIVTEVSPLEKFFPAEEYHQNYFAKNPYQGYCQAVIAPKLTVFQKELKGYYP
ncbi:MAG: peptide-methionine (S)-S-oxide reductase MsrA [Candidatus Peregrinibacteria bacterium]